MEYGREIVTIQAPNIKGPAVSDKSPRQAMSKKSGTLKEKRAAKHAKSAAKEASAVDAVLHDKKR